MLTKAPCDPLQPSPEEKTWPGVRPLEDQRPGYDFFCSNFVFSDHFLDPAGPILKAGAGGLKKKTDF